MKKMKLNLTELQVDSFETAKPRQKTGTVVGHLQQIYSKEGEITCNAHEFTCGPSVPFGCTEFESCEIDVCIMTHDSFCNNSHDFECNL